MGPRADCMRQSNRADPSNGRDEWQRLEVVVAPRSRTQHAVKCVLGSDNCEHENYAAIENAIGEDLPASEEKQRHEYVENHSREERRVEAEVAALQKVKHERLEDELVAVELVEDRAERGERECENNAGDYRARDSAVRDGDENQHDGKRDHRGQLDCARNEE